MNHRLFRVPVWVAFASTALLQSAAGIANNPTLAEKILESDLIVHGAVAEVIPLAQGEVVPEDIGERPPNRFVAVAVIDVEQVLKHCPHCSYRVSDGGKVFVPFGSLGGPGGVSLDGDFSLGPDQEYVLFLRSLESRWFFEPIVTQGVHCVFDGRVHLDGGSYLSVDDFERKRLDGRSFEAASLPLEEFKKRIGLGQGALRKDRGQRTDNTRLYLPTRPKVAAGEGAPREGQPWTVPGLGIEMIWCPPGEFLMGTPEGEVENRNVERQHPVRLTEGFWIGQHEVTQGQWEALMGDNPSRFRNAGKDAPVEGVSWLGCRRFGDRLTERERAAGRIQAGLAYGLPTEAQWEYACRVGTTGAVYTGPLTIKGFNHAPELDLIGWYAGNSGVDYDGAHDSSDWVEMHVPHRAAGTHPVGRKRPNPWGLYDSIGNVGEWVHDWVEQYPGKLEENPLGPYRGAGRAIRGGLVVDVGGVLPIGLPALGEPRGYGF